MKTSIPVTEIVYGAMGTADVQKANAKEFEMALQDYVMEDTKDMKNVTESYVYDMRDKLSDIYQEFVTDSERENFIAKLQEMEDWLYEDREDETRGVYISKIEELKKQGDLIKQQYKEYTERAEKKKFVNAKAEAFDRVCRPIITKPKPATPNTPSCQSPQRGEKQPLSEETPNAGNANATIGTSAGSEVPPVAKPI
ncbi:hypothetical protein KY290_031334 [Solanum tuberosum]|uniref:Uncharacterized protein n=1 Tax=Solanum tuberosum TaxID=4113 RepID=A0ABQ7UAH1_SOLTU|nr:hypothetical protein KY290_031334 [Solanum tuberosum]